MATETRKFAICDWCKIEVMYDTCRRPVGWKIVRVYDGEYDSESFEGHDEICPKCAGMMYEAMQKCGKVLTEPEDEEPEDPSAKEIENL